jgi:putative endonuclease
LSRLDAATGLPGIELMIKNWQVYIILCSDNSFYTGITTDLERRFRQHAEGGGAKYFRGRQPIKVVYFETCHNRSSAARRELLIKAMGRADKEILVSRQAMDRFKA